MTKTKTLWGILLAILLTTSTLSAQKFTISGYIEDADSGEKLIAATAYDRSSGSGIVSNTYGFYSLTLPKGDVDLSFSYIGYDKQDLKFKLTKDTIINIGLSGILELAEVIVTAEKSERIEQQVQMSKITIPIEQIKKVPALLGEVDVLKTLQLLPGVQGGTEGQTGIYVRGGSPDQNLILLDGVPVYNVSHLLGFFSVFNADAIKNVTLVKGGFPARYGGRLSSVIDINMKEGNMQEFHGEGGIGLISSRLTLEGPIVKNKASFIVSGRRTYVDVIARPIIKSASQGEGLSNFDPTLYFYDLNAKVNYKINDKHRLFLSSYSGKDIFGLSYDENFNGGSSTINSGTNWGNLTTALRWNYMINNKLFANTTMTYSRYRFKFGVGFEETVGNKKEETSAFYYSGIYDLAGKVDFDYIPNPNHYIRFGGGATRHTYEPGATQLKVNVEEFQLDTLLGDNRIFSTEPYLYVEDEIQLGALKASVGVHFSAFKVGDAFYKSLQPRLGLNYLLNDQYAVKGSFCTMAQFINLLTNEALSLPTDLWLPSTPNIKPQESWQVALGIARTIKDDIEISVEGYYKKMNNVLSYKPGASFLQQGVSWEEKVLQGEGESYGAELLVQKKKGKTTGWIGYTLAWNNRRFDGINAGEWFPFKYDRRHDVEFVVSHELTPKISISASWVYGTGNSITLPVQQYQTPQQLPDFILNTGQLQPVTISGGKNQYRMNPYHRMDIGIEFKKKRSRWERTWAIGAYNAYNHANPYFVTSSRDQSGEAGYYQISLYPIIPYFSYNFKF